MSTVAPSIDQKSHSRPAVDRPIGESSFQEINLQDLHESPHNPRKHFGDTALEELTLSIEQVGIIDPLVVRPNATGFEIAAGHRRYRAAKALQLKTVPCRVLPLTDQQFMEILTISNLQREDVHPLDEAKGYEALMAAPYRMDVQTVAGKVGRSVKYIYDRVKLLALSKECQDLFWAGTITAGHAILLARLSSADQKRCIEGGGLLREEHTLYTRGKSTGKYDGQTAVSVRELEDWIKRHVRFDHTKPDRMLFPETASALQEAANEGAKIVEITDEYLASYDVRGADRKKRVFGSQSWRRADGKQACDYTVLGVFAAGAQRGQTLDVCVRRDKCTKHWGKEITARGKKAHGQSSRSAAQDRYQKQRDEHARKMEQERAQRERWESAAPKIIAAVLERVKTMPASASGFLADRVVASVFRGRNFKIPGLMRGKTLEDLIRYLGAVTLIEEIKGWNAIEEFPKVAKHLSIDLSKILPAEPKAKVQTSALKEDEDQKAADKEVRRENRRGNTKGRAIEKRRAKKGRGK